MCAGYQSEIRSNSLLLERIKITGSLMRSYISLCGKAVLRDFIVITYKTSLQDLIIIKPSTPTASIPSCNVVQLRNPRLLRLVSIRRLRRLCDLDNSYIIRRLGKFQATRKHHSNEFCMPFNHPNWARWIELINQKVAGTWQNIVLQHSVNNLSGYNF